MRHFNSVARMRQARWEHLTKIHEVTKQYANLPESYIKEMVERETYRNPKGKCYSKKSWYRVHDDYGDLRPWAVNTMQLKESPYRFVEPIKDWLFFAGDRVEVLVGRDKGKQGLISSVVAERNWVFVSGLNMKLKERKDEEGTMYELKEAPLLVTSQVALVDPGDLQPTKAEYAVTEDGDVVRRSVRTGRIIPYSKEKYVTYDYESRDKYVESPKDTPLESMKATFVPKLKTFEMDIAEEHGIKEERTPAKTFWY